MTYRLNDVEYENTKKKHEFLKERLALLRERTDVAPWLKAHAMRSYEDMIDQLGAEMHLYEATRDQAYRSFR